MLKLFKRFKRIDWILIIISIMLVSSQVYLDLKLPDYMSEITVLVQTEGNNINEILVNGGYMLLCALGSLILAIFTGLLAANIAANFSRNLRKELFTKVENLSIGKIKLFKTSSLITRSTNDITQIQRLISMGLQLLIKAPITAVWAITKILNKSWQWSVATSIAVVILLFIIGILIVVVLPGFKRVQKMIDEINNVTRENLTGIRVVRAFNAEKYQEDKFEEVNNRLTNQQLFNQKTFAILSPVIYLIMYLLTLTIYILGARLIDGAMMSEKIRLFGDMVVFSSYAMQVITAFLMLALIFIMLPRAQVSASRINEVLDTEDDIIDGNKKQGLEGQKGTVEFKNVSFKYPDAEDYILKDISFKVNTGETIAFIGSTGSGKSTLINLVPRFYDVTDGEILIDGVNVKDYELKKLYNKIGYVPQKAMLFNGTVDYNVRFGDNEKEKSDEIIKKAINIAQAEEFVLKMDNKYNENISQGGTNISGGQKQRLQIARAIARDPEIYIFDDSFSALDYKTDSILRHELKNYTKNATTLIVATRIGTIMNSDKIVVLDNGKCVGIGTHKELLENCEIYKEIALSQLTEEELANGK